MKISELIKELEKVKEKYGDVECVYGYASCDIAEYVEPQKCIKYINTIWNEEEIDTEDLDENYLEESHKDKILESSIVIKIY